MRVRNAKLWKKGAAGNQDQINADAIISFNADCEPVYGFPIIKKSKIPDIVDDDVVQISGNSANWIGKVVNGFTDDYRLNAWWKNMHQYCTKKVESKAVFTPDYSIYSNMPMWMQIYQLGRSRFIGCYLQSYGIPVVPTITWTDMESHNRCTAGIDKGTTIAISTIVGKDFNDKRIEKQFVSHIEKVIELIEPTTVYVYNRRFVQSLNALHNDMRYLHSHTQKLNIKNASKKN